MPLPIVSTTSVTSILANSAIVNASIAADKALIFNGTSAIASFGNVLLTNNVISVGGVITLTANSSNNFDIVFGYGNTRWFLILNGNTSQIAFNIKTGGVERSSGYTSSLTLNTPYFVIGTYDPNAGTNNLTISVYNLLGVLVFSSSATTTGNIDTTAQPLQIGHDPNRSLFTHVNAERMVMYDRILTAAEMSNSAQGVTISRTNIIGEWLIQEGSGTTIADTGGGNTGTLSGAPLPTWTTGAYSDAITGRGVQYGTTPMANYSVDETGSLSTGSFSESISNLSGGNTYYARGYATTSTGTNYGAWVSFATINPTYSITINGVNRTADIVNGSIQITDQLTIQQNTMSFKLVDVHSLGVPITDQEIILTMNDSTRLFAGYVVKVSQMERKGSYIMYQIDCMDYVRLLDRNLVNDTYLNMTDAAIISDLISTYCPGFGITGTNVVSGVTISQMSFNYIQVSQAIRKICDLTGRNWYIDYNKDVHYFPLTQSAAPFNITDTNTFSSGHGFFKMQFRQDATQLKNRVYVRGGTKLSDPTTYSVKGDGVSRKFPLPDKPHSTSLTVNGVSKSIGVKNIDLTGFDYYLNFEEKYLEQDSTGVIPTTSDTITLTYTYDIPILVAVENSASIAANGVHEFAIFDTTISTTQAARDRASAELTDYANSLVEAQFNTYTDGFRSGQYVNINSALMGVTNTNYFIQKVTAQDLGSGTFVYTVFLASAKTMGIIRFLIEMLERQNNLVLVSSSEVLDNLLSLTDSLNSDSLTDNLVIDSAGPYSTWCTDSLQVTPTTRMRWNLFQWR